MNSSAKYSKCKELFYLMSMWKLLVTFHFCVSSRHVFPTISEFLRRGLLIPVEVHDVSYQYQRKITLWVTTISGISLCEHQYQWKITLWVTTVSGNLRCGLPIYPISGNSRCRLFLPSVEVCSVIYFPLMGGSLCELFLSPLEVTPRASHKIQTSYVVDRRAGPVFGA